MEKEQQKRCFLNNGTVMVRIGTLKGTVKKSINSTVARFGTVI